MSIVKMKRLRLIGLISERAALLQQLLHIGCLEISEPVGKSDDPDWAALLQPDNITSLNDLRGLSNGVNAALGTLRHYAPVKTGLFERRSPIGEGEFFSKGIMDRALQAADLLNEHKRQIDLLYSEENELTVVLNSLKPWASMDIPLDDTFASSLSILFGTAPADLAFEQIKADLAGQAPTGQLLLAGTGKDVQYLVLLCHRAEEAAAVEALRRRSFRSIGFPGLSGTPSENVAEISKRLSQIKAERDEHIAAIAALGDRRQLLKICADRLTQETAKESAREKLLTSGTIFFMEGWVPAPDCEKLINTLSGFACAFELSDPLEGDKVPTKLKNSGLVSSVNVVTEMYSLPAYGSIDPNPLIFPFYVIFFGMMYADLAYGAIIFAISQFLIHKYRPKGSMGSLLHLARVCGVTTFIWGFLSGSFFGNMVSVVAETFFGIKNFVLYVPVLDPVQNPLPVLYLALGFGIIQILFGMGLHAYLCIRDHHPLDALFDVGSWWLVFGGIVMGVLKGNFILCYIGAAMLILTQGRSSPTLPGKLGGGIASLYSITGFMGDVLSYSRLMALMLASSVIANLVNILGALAGNIVVFIIIFCVGHAFNMSINIIGTYVHAARLQYLEFFGKFYRGGGIPFRPLAYNTKYVDIVEEEI